MYIIVQRDLEQSLLQALLAAVWANTLSTAPLPRPIPPADACSTRLWPGIESKFPGADRQVEDEDTFNGFSPTTVQRNSNTNTAKSLWPGLGKICIFTPVHIF